MLGLLTSFNPFATIFCWSWDIGTCLQLNSCSSQTLSTVTKQSEIVDWVMTTIYIPYLRIVTIWLLISPQYPAYSIYLITSRRTNKFTFSISYITTNNNHLLRSLDFSLVFHGMNFAESVGRIDELYWSLLMRMTQLVADLFKHCDA